MRRRRDPIPIAGRSVAVTGGARGIGRAIAAELVHRGARVTIGDVDVALAERTASEIGARGAALDVTDRAAFAAFLAAAGPVDVLVNNAGVLHVGPFLDTPEDWIRRQVEINLVAVIHGMQLALPGMLARGRGHVVNIASSAAKVGVRNEAVYAATKHGVYGVSESVRYELRGSGVELTCVMPGLVRTELAAGTLSAKGITVVTPEAVAAAVAGAIERPRFELFVPRSYGALAKLTGALPPRGRGALLRALGAERATSSATRADREAYEERMRALTGTPRP
ncbi:MAG TPA: SDR family oxidoreductase [Solirubrobacteraceae bacterium]|nr:SDR family oxidoreductase [Solirubrobacteraceae bacterium]